MFVKEEHHGVRHKSTAREGDVSTI